MTTKQALIETLSRALAALRAGQLDDAEALARDLVAAEPRDPAAQQLAAHVAFRRGRFAEAVAWARQCLAARPDHAPTLILAGRAARAQGDLGGAKSWLRRAGAVPQSGPEPLVLLAIAEIESADPQAGATQEALLQRYPGEAQGWHDIGVASMRLGRLEEAEAAFGRAAAVSGEVAPAVDLGRVLLARGRAAEAVAVLRRALGAAPDRLEPLLPLAQALRQIGAPQEARQHLLQLIERRGASPHAFFTLGLVCDDLRDWPGSIAAYRRCLDLQPDMPEAHVNLGLALQKTDALEAAMACYRRALQLRPDTFGRIAQALPSTRKGTLWLDPGALRRSLEG